MKNVKDKWLKVLDFLDLKMNQKRGYFAIYTFVFLIVALGVFVWYIAERRSFIWNHDGQQQHFNALMYYGTYLRNIGRQLLRGYIDIPLWDFTFGFGGDILTNLHYYAIGDPLTLLSVFVPTRYTEHLYNFLVVFRLYLAGLSFSLYSFKLKKEPWPVLIGALIYAFCGFALSFPLRHPFFANPLIYFPLLCLGVEKVFRGEKPHTFIIMICISLASSFYFFYMISILIVIYTIVRFFFVYDKFSYKVLINDFIKFSFYYLLGVLMASVIAFPNIYALFLSARKTLSHSIPLFYPMTYYQEFVPGFISAENIGASSWMGYASISLIAALYLMLFARKKKDYNQLRIGFVILTIILFFPFLGHVMHGFSYISNRWIWGYSFLVSFIVTSLLPELIELSSKKAMILASFIFAYVLFIIFTLDVRNAENLTMAIILIVKLIILFTASRYQIKRSVKYVNLLIVTVVNIIVLGAFLYAPHARDFVSAFHRTGLTMPFLHQSPTESVKHLVEEDFFRVEENHFATSFVRNAAIQTRVNSSSFYWSLSNPYVGQFLDEIHHWRDLDAIYTGLDGRAMLGALASTRYFIVRSGHEAFIPYGYYQEPVGETVVLVDDNQTHRAFLNSHALPLGYAYNDYMTRSQYDQLSFIQRQQGLMQAVLLEDLETSEDIPLNFNDHLLAYDVKLNSGITFDDQKIYVYEPNASLTLTFETIPNSEIYINFNNIHFEGDADRLCIEDDDNRACIEGDANRARVRLQNDYLRKVFDLATPDNVWYIGRHHFALNMGYYEQSKLTEVTISFRDLGTYTFESIEVIAQPMDLFPEMVASLNEYTLENLEMTTNQIAGTIELPDDRILVLSIPYSKGWRAYINDEPVEMMRANTMFMAMNVPAGHHDITLRYRTPLLVESIIATFVGWTMFGGVVVYFKKKTKVLSVDKHR